jgi:hypothetical protein
LFQKFKEFNIVESLKRPEENYKFVFKRCLKHMKEAFRAGIPQRRVKKKDFDKAFYEHYFKAISDTEGISLENFYHPKNSQSKNKNLPKTINTGYIDNISKSKLFLKEFTDYLCFKLEEECRDIVDSKISGLINKWEHEFQLSNKDDKTIGDICNYIENNKKCKLPWTVNEVKEAIMVVKKLFCLI